MGGVLGQGLESVDCSTGRGVSWIQNGGDSLVGVLEYGLGLGLGLGGVLECGIEYGLGLG